MRSKLQIALIVCLAVCLLTVFDVGVFAADSSSSAKRVKSVTDPSGRLTIMTPDKGQVFYKGEKIIYKVRDKDIFDNESVYEDQLVIEVKSVSTGKNVYDKTYDSYEFSGKSDTTFTGKLSASDFPNGSYEFNVTHNKGKWETPDEYNNYFNLAPESVFTSIIVTAKFKIATLKPPKSMVATAGKKKVVIKYTKATGAKKYQIYRYSKKAKKYKLIATTSKTKYTDKKVKKGNKYRYKVRSYRSGNGTVKSKFTSVRMTKKVK